MAAVRVTEQAVTGARRAAGARGTAEGGPAGATALVPRSAAAMHIAVAEVAAGWYEPAPWTVRTVRGEPAAARMVPPGPEPLPRRTTPLVERARLPWSWKVPGARRTAPRSPASSGRAEAAARADWMAA